MKKKPSIPFEFVLEQLYSVNVEIRPMFGCFAIYVHNKIVLMLKEENNIRLGINGVMACYNKRAS
jgi:TfoX/Sxy family transcriptional regulator of competence genes